MSARKYQLIPQINLNWSYLEGALENYNTDSVILNWIFQGYVHFETILGVYPVEIWIENAKIWEQINQNKD